MKLVVLALLAFFALAGGAQAQSCGGVPNANQICAAPNGSSGFPSFRAMVNGDIPAGASNTVKGTLNGTSETDLTATQLTTLCNLVTGSLSGCVPSFPNTVTTFFRGDGTYNVPPTVTSGAPGYVPAFPNNTTTFFRGDGTYAVPLNSAAVDAAFGSTRGALLERGAAGWQIITPGTSGLPWVSNGAGADGAYQALTNSGIASGTILNSNLANMAAGTVKANATGSPAAPQDATATSWFDQAYCNTVGFLVVRLSGAWTCSQGIPVNINWFSGVDPTGVADSTTGLQNIINAAPATGQRLYCTGNYKISTSVTIGNGSGAAGSTTQGLILEGIGNPTTPFTLGGFTSSTGCRFFWAGAAADMFQIKGPLQGWGIKNVLIDCLSTANVGIHVTSAQAGQNENIVIKNCLTHGVLSDTVPVFAPFTNTDSYGNSWNKLYVTVANSAGAHGVTLTGGTTANTDYNNFYTVAIAFSGNCVNCVGWYMAASDSNHVINLQFPGGSGSNVACVGYDYTIFNGWPASNTIDGIDTGTTAGGCATPYAQAGTPGAGAKPNYLVNIVETNSGTVPTQPFPNVAAFSSSHIILSTGANNINGHMTLDTHGNMGFKGTAPTLTAGCNGAGSAVTGSNYAGIVSSQTAAATTCTLTFANSGFALTAPACTVTGLNPALTNFTFSATTITVNFPSTASYQWTYNCPSIN